MFDKNAIDTYKSINASEDLRERVLSMEPQVTTQISKSFYFRYRKVLAYTACLVLLVSAAFFLTRSAGDITISLNGGIVGYEPMQVVQEDQMPSMARTMSAGVPPTTVILEIEVDSNTEVTVSNGTLLNNDDELLFDASVSDSLELSADAKIIWKVNDPTMEDSPRMTIKTNGKVTNFLLEYNLSSNSWSIRQENESN